MTIALPPLPLGLQTFDTLRESGMAYVDKTGFIPPLVTRYSRVFFSRPRRFGKSLFLSTLAAYFAKKEELFLGLEAEGRLPPEPHPVLHLDLSTYSSTDPLAPQLIERLELQAREHGVTITATRPSAYFSELIRQLAKDGKVVVLVDEYDKPLTDALLADGDLLGRNLIEMKSFYSVLKAEDRHLRFCFITGVSRFSKVSIFSGVNNLKDISFLPDYATLCGYTKEEVVASFGPFLERAAHEMQLSEERFIAELERFYNGYRFTASTCKVFNPLSVLECFDERAMRSFWFETATPSFLVTRVRSEGISPVALDRFEGVTLQLEAADIRATSLPDLLFQTGYLTIQSAHTVGHKRTFELGWPNQEVRQSFYEQLLLSYTAPIPGAGGQSLATALFEALSDGRIDEFILRFNALLASIPYHLFTDRESYYHSTAIRSSTGFDSSRHPTRS